MNEDIKSYNLSVDETLSVYNTNFDGLSESEAGKRLEKYGKNKLIDKNNKTTFKCYANNFNCSSNNFVSYSKTK